MTHGKPAGTGLGLALAAKAVEDHGGSLSVESAPDQGATLAIRLPQARLVQVALPPAGQNA